MGGIIITNHAREEDIEIQRYPLNLEILAKLGTMAASSSSVDAKQNLLFEITCLGRFIGPRVSEDAQTSPNKVDYHTYTSGTKVIKAFIANNFVFYDKAVETFDLVDTACLDREHKVRITWRIQKNRQNGQAITLSADKVGHQVCPICAAAWMVLRARCLGKPD